MDDKLRPSQAVRRRRSYMAKYARVTIAEGSPEALDEAVDGINRIVIPRARELDGFLSGTWAADRETGKVYSMVVFDSEQHLRDSQEAAAGLRKEVGERLGVRFTVEELEVIAEA